MLKSCDGRRLRRATERRINCQGITEQKLVSAIFKWPLEKIDRKPASRKTRTTSNIQNVDAVRSTLS